MAKRINARKILPKPRNPQDSTRRNVQAANKRIADLRMELDALQARVTNLERAQPTPAPESGGR